MSSCPDIWAQLCSGHVANVCCWKRGDEGAQPWQCISIWVLREENVGTTPCCCSKPACSCCSCWCRARRTSSACQGACRPPHRNSTAILLVRVTIEVLVPLAVRGPQCLRVVAERGGRWWQCARCQQSTELAFKVRQALQAQSIGHKDLLVCNIRRVLAEDDHLAECCTRSAQLVFCVNWNVVVRQGLHGEVERDASGAVLEGRVIYWVRGKRLPVPLAMWEAMVSRHSRTLKELILT